MKSGWWSRRAISLHVALVVAVPLFLALGAWQLSRALHGNLLSWAYTFEWPFFAGYATWMWWKLVHEEVAARAAAAQAEADAGGGDGGADLDGAPFGTEGDTVSARPSEPATIPAGTAGSPPPPALWDPYDDADPELAAYNRYLASLHTQRPKR
ncbi:MAG TPA: hypothetical protein VEH29_14135 [Acidimicrobiales bacterium]|nr:hypothetical protein [Acidimicrobiales bacterium]